MFKKLLWATDGSAPADAALPYIRSLAESGAEVVVAHCEERTVPVTSAGSYPFHANEDELQEKIERQVAEISAAGVPATLRLSRAQVGGAAHAIAETAGETGAEIIVVGTRGHTPLGGLLVGSVTQRLLHIAPCPVLAVPQNGHHGH